MLKIAWNLLLIYPKAIGLRKVFGYIPTALVESEKGFFTFSSLVVTNTLCVMRGVGLFLFGILQTCDLIDGGGGGGGIHILHDPLLPTQYFYYFNM